MFLDIISVMLMNFKIRDDLEYMLYAIYFLLVFSGLHGLLGYLGPKME